MHPKQHGIHVLCLNRQFKLRSLLKLLISEFVQILVARSFWNKLLLFTRVICMRMHPKPRGIHAFYLNRSSKCRSFFQLLILESVPLQAACSFWNKLLFVHTSSLYDNTSKTTRHSCFSLKSIIQALKFVPTTHFGIHAILGFSFILKHIDIVYTCYLYVNASKPQGILAFHLNRSCKLKSLFKLLVS